MLNEMLAEMNRALAMKPAEDQEPARNGEDWPAVGWHGSCTWGAREEWYECVILPGQTAAINKHGQWMVMGPGRLESPQFDDLPSLEDRARTKVCTRAYQSLPPKALSTVKRRAHAVRIIGNLYDADLLGTAG